MSCTKLEDILEKFNDFTRKPVKYLTVQNEISDDVKNLVKSIYDYTKHQEDAGVPSKGSALSELIVQDFDEEQIWQEIELQNAQCWDRLVVDVASSVTAKDGLKFPLKEPVRKQTYKKHRAVDKPKVEEKNEDNHADSNEEMEYDSDDENEVRKHITSKKGVKASIVDDEFFKLNEMEQFLLKEERNENVPKKNVSDSDDESIDMFEGDEDEGLEYDDQQNVMYSDFFDGDSRNNVLESNKKKKATKKNENFSNVDEDDELGSDGSLKHDEIQADISSSDKKLKKAKKTVRFSNIDNKSSSDYDSNSEDENKTGEPENKISEKQSEFEQRQMRLKRQIENLESKSLKENPWQLKGEVDASKRPQNSLLQEVVDFDLTTRPPPIITEQTTVTLEDIILRRIRDKAWDDVVRKAKPVEDVVTFKKPIILDQSKSELSLAQVYEAEYLKQKHGTGEDDPKEPDSHVKIRDTMSKLFAKLDALSHYHYTPKAPQPDVKIVSNTPAISMEEVAPVATSDAALLAPEEVKRQRRSELMSKEERTTTDKNRERRKKKKLQREKGKFEKKDAAKTKKTTEVNDLKTVKTSKAFFEHLNDGVNSLIKPGKVNKRKIVNNKGQ